MVLTIREVNVFSSLFTVFLDHHFPNIYFFNLRRPHSHALHANDPAAAVLATICLNLQKLQGFLHVYVLLYRY